MLVGWQSWDRVCSRDFGREGAKMSALFGEEHGLGTLR